MTERKENSSSWRKRTRSTQKSKQIKGDIIQNQQSRVAIRRKKNNRTVVRNFVKEFNNAKIDPTWMRNRKGGSQVKTWKDKKRSWQSWKKLGENRIWWRRKQSIKERTRTNQQSHSGGRHKLEQGKGMGTGRGLWKKRKWTSGSLEVRGLQQKKKNDSIPQYLRWTNAVRKKLRNYWKKLLAEWRSKFRITGE